MGEAVLVRADLAPDLIDAGRTLLMELDSQAVHFNAAFWLLDAANLQWNLYLGARSVRENGSLSLYKKVDRVLRNLALVDRIWIGMISIVDLGSKIVQVLTSALGAAVSVDGARLDNAIMDGMQSLGAWSIA